MSKKETFVRRDKELVWLENPPVKPIGWNLSMIWSQYTKALTQAIADAPVVKDEWSKRKIAFTIGEQCLGIPLTSSLIMADIKEKTPYEVEIEGEIEIGPDITGGNRYFARLIQKPKQENDMKETCETCNGTGLVAKTIHTDNGDFDADDQTCQECGGHGIIHFPNEERLSEQCQACESTGRAKQDREEVKRGHKRANGAIDEDSVSKYLQSKFTLDEVEADEIASFIGGLVTPPETESREELLNKIWWEAGSKPLNQFKEYMNKFTIHRKQ